MTLFELVSFLITLAAVLSYVNLRWLKLPPTIGLMTLALACSLTFTLIGLIFPSIEQRTAHMMERIDFNEAVMNGMLGFLLFAGALHINLGALSKHWRTIASLASVGVVLSTLLIGVFAYGLMQWILGIEIRFVYCLLFGALISPTDPIAVLGILKQAQAPKDLETKIAGESLFNDGTAVVVFLGLYEITVGQQPLDLLHLSELFVQEAVGGAVFGFGIGYLGYRMLKTVDNYQVEILLSLAVAAGGYALALALHLSGPIAMVVAGLLIGNHGRTFAMSETTIEHLDTFWELIDEILNAILFVLIGLEVLILTLTQQYLLAGLALVPFVLLARWLAVAGPLQVVRRYESIHPRALPILTWGGLRGGISVALALSIPTKHADGTPIPERDLILAMTYVIVVFSIMVQGLSFGALIRYLIPPSSTEAPAVPPQDASVASTA